MYKDEVDEHGLVAPLVPKPEYSGDENMSVSIHPSVAAYARSLDDKIAPGLWYMSDQRPNGDYHRDIPRTEQKAFADLLQQMLEYKLEARTSAGDAINHEWFRL